MTEDHYVVAQLYSMTIPVSILAVMMAVIVYVQDLKIEPISELSLEVVAKVVFVVLLAATFISYAFALLFFFKYNRTMHWLNFLAMFVPTAWLVWRITSIMLLAYNIAIFTAYAILYREEHRIEKLSNCGILVAALALAWPASYLDEMSVWASLLALGCWDCFAVLISVGPFALILHEQQRRIWMGESSKLTPGLVYHSASGYDLGSGDLVVYAVLLLRSLMRRSLAVAFATLIGILTGHGITVLWSIRRREGNSHDASRGTSVPALPAALALGLFLYFASLQGILSYVIILTKKGYFV